MASNLDTGAGDAGRRLPAAQRQRSIVQAASRLIADHGYVPLPLDKLASEAEVSRSLLYARFETQYELLNAVLELHIELLEAAGLIEAARGADLEGAALAAARIYFDHVAEHGPVIHVLIRELYFRGHASPALRQRRDRAFAILTRRLKRSLLLSIDEATVAVRLALAIPEEAGRLVRQGRLSRDAGETLALTLVRSSFQALAPARL